jgi:CO dehydrogenase/acetyl-CoA synthase beta subunit
LRTEKQIEKGISDLVGCLTDPIIVFPSPWAEDIPESLKNRVPLARLARQMTGLRGIMPEGDDDLATDVEALIYMYPRCLEAPLDHDWTRIYLYLGTKVMGSDKIPEDIKVDKLHPDQERQLNELKRWIRDQQRKAAAGRRRAEQRQEKEEEIERRRAEQPALFDFS